MGWVIVWFCLGLLSPRNLSQPILEVFATDETAAINLSTASSEIAVRPHIDSTELLGKLISKPIVILELPFDRDRQSLSVKFLFLFREFWQCVFLPETIERLEPDVIDLRFPEGFQARDGACQRP